MGKTKKSDYRGQRAIPNGLPTFAEKGRANRKSNAKWSNRMCSAGCWNRGTVYINGLLYCRDCAAREAEE